MLLKKVSTIAITFVASLALASGAAVLARQAAAFPREGQTDEQRDERKFSGDNELSNTSASSGALSRESTDQQDEAIDQLELLRLDVELLGGEVDARKLAISHISQSLIQMRVSGRAPDSNQILQGQARQDHLEALEKTLNEKRNEWIVKNRELRKKKSELAELEANAQREKSKRVAGIRSPQTAGKDKREADRKNAASHQLASSPSIAPVLENRLSEIERKLDSVLKALENLKREPRE